MISGVERKPQRCWVMTQNLSAAVRPSDLRTCFSLSLNHLLSCLHSPLHIFSSVLWTDFKSWCLDIGFFPCSFGIGALLHSSFFPTYLLSIFLISPTMQNCINGWKWMGDRTKDVTHNRPLLTLTRTRKMFLSHPYTSKKEICYVFFGLPGNVS